MLRVEIRGNTELRSALRKFAPDLDKNLREQISFGLKPVVTAARGFVPSDSPMTGWEKNVSRKITNRTSVFRRGKFPLYNPAIIKRGIIFSTSVTKHNKNGWTGMAAIMNTSALGAIYEIAGRTNPDGQPWVGPRAGDSKKVSRSSNPHAGAQFIANLGELTSSLQGQGRLIYRAWAQDRGRAHNIVNKAIFETKKEFYARNSVTPFSKAA